MTLPKRILKSRKEERLRCPAHLKWLRGFHCSVPNCDRRPIEAAHIRMGLGGGMSLKPDDDRTISLCSHHHAEQHRMGENPFAELYGLDLISLAAEFAKASPALKRLRASNPPLTAA